MKSKPAQPTDELGAKASHRLLRDDAAQDVGPTTLATWLRLLTHEHAASCVVWLGSMGAVENPASAAASVQLADCLATRQTFSLVAGSSLVNMLSKKGLLERLPAVSTAGGALLAALQGRPLPGIPGGVVRHRRAAAVSPLQFGDLT